VTESNRCAHLGCNCVAAENSKYCGEYCERMGAETESRCECGHPKCQSLGRELEFVRRDRSERIEQHAECKGDIR